MSACTGLSGVVPDEVESMRF